jgi:hypothetical protein
VADSVDRGVGEAPGSKLADVATSADGPDAAAAFSASIFL